MALCPTYVDGEDQQQRSSGTGIAFYSRKTNKFKFERAISNFVIVQQITCCNSDNFT